MKKNKPGYFLIIDPQKNTLRISVQDEWLIEQVVAIDKLELIASSKGDPMVSIWFKILAGDFKGSRIFMNQVITQGFQIHIVNELLRSMGTGVEVEFVTYKQYGNLLMDVMEAIDGNLEFALSYKEGKKGFSTYEITEVFEVE